MCARNLALLALLVVGSGLLASTALAADDRVPEGLSASDWSGIRAAYEAKRHEAFAVDGGYQARNPGQQWRTRFDGRGFLTTPDADGWTWGLELLSIGRCDAQRAVTTPACVDARSGRVEYEWDKSLTEWFINDRRGLEHGYTIQERPDVGITGSQEQYLRIELAVRGSLVPHVSGDARTVTFCHSNGAEVVSYSGLTVFDATGALVPAWFETVTDCLRLSIDDSGAVYPLTIDPIAQQAYLKASNTGASDQFGWSVAVSGDTVVVGATGEDSNATGVNGNQANNSAADSGAAYVFVRSSGAWNQQAYLKASNTGAGDQFGRSVAATGDTVVIGAWLEDSSATGVNGNQANNGASDSGAAYVFVRNDEVWSQQAYLKASNTGIDDYFGSSVSVSGDTVVVASQREDSNATGVNGNQADNSAFGAGAAYVFVRSGTVWSQQAYLKASNTGADDSFGESVSVSGETVVVGAYREDSNATGVNGNQANNSASDSGAAYVFVRSGGVWSQQAYVKTSNTEAGDRFGVSVSVSGDTVVIGSDLEDSSATGVNGNQADNSAADSGAAYVFVRNGGVWSQQAYLKASNTGPNDGFGNSLALSGDTVVVGAELEDSIATGVNGNQADNSASNAGAAYVFVRSGGVWSQQAYLKASNGESGDQFGFAVGADGDTAVVGARGEDSNVTGVDGNQANNSATESGAAYVFTNIGCPILGNLNCDCEIDLSDLDAFVLALLDPAGYISVFPTCDILRGDMQPDGIVDGTDVQGFVNLLIP